VPNQGGGSPTANIGGILQVQDGDRGDPETGDLDDSAPSAGALAGRPSIRAIRTSAPPKIDGLLDDAIWRTAVQIKEFVQQRPVEGAPATEQTEVFIAYDSQNLYFGIYAHYSDMKLLRANHADRDSTGRDDTVGVFFDPFLDQQRGYAFSVNAYGVQADALIRGGGGPGGGGGGPGEGGGGGGQGGGPGGGGRGPGQGPGFMRGVPADTSWNALFRSGGTLVSDGWTAEMAIPFKSLRYPARGRGLMHRWGFQIQREIGSKDESVVWAPITRDIPGFLRQMGTIEGLSDLSTSRNLEFLPSLTAIQSHTLNSTTALYGNSDVEEGGVGLKYGVTSNLTLDFTYNPDFSQIESDRQQIEVNQRFPVFYPELRPFFIEGQEIFNIQGPVNLVHTRTIVDPRYGAKLTGKVRKMTMGLVVANDEGPGKVDDPSDPAFDKTAQFTIARARYDLYSESSIGAIFTDREFLDQYSRVGGLDAQFRLGRNQRLTLRGVGSSHRDSAGVERTGNMIDLSFRKEGRNLNVGVMHFAISPDFKTDAGFVRRVNERQTGVNASYRWWPQTWVINAGPRVDYSRNYTFDGTLQDEQIGGGFNVQFARNIFVNGNLDYDMERYDNINYRKTRFNFGGGMNTSRKVSFGGFANTGDQIRYVIGNSFLGSGSQYNLFVTIRPLTRLQSEINLSTSRLVDPRIKSEVFDIKIWRTLTTYQFSERFLVRNIMEFNNYDRTLGANVLMTYRVNAGTAFYVGYDDRYKQGDRINPLLLPTDTLQRTNRAFFTKLQILLRY